MCGIYVFVSHSQVNNNFLNINQASLSIKQRGPENTTIISNNDYYLSFHRLAIQNTSPEGNQPFIYHEKNYTYYILCNGEIYNYKDLIIEFNLSNIKNDCNIIYPLFNHFILNGYSLLDSFKKLNQKLNGEFSIVLIEVSNINNQIINLLTSTDQCSIRPLFQFFDNKTIILSSLLKGITNIKNISFNDNVRRMNGYEITHFQLNKNIYERNIYSYKDHEKEIYLEENLELYKKIVETFYESVKIRLHSDRPLACLLSGGLDSSLVASIASRELKKYGKKLKTFTIGLKGGTDLEYAKKVANYIDSEHTEINFTEEEGLSILEDVIKCCESFDITTIRASVGQHLISKWISKNTDIKVVLNGDGSDEIHAGYLYSHLAPNGYELQKDLNRLINDIHYFDGLRVDRNISHFGLEARLPFLDKNVVELNKSISGDLKIPKQYNGKIIEKYLLRKSFDVLIPDILPKEVLFRRKEAFSDALSSRDKSWFEIIQNWINKKINIDMYKYYDYLPPISKESRWYREIFEKEFHKDVVNIIPYFWMPKWIESNDPSARTINIYNHLQN